MILPVIRELAGKYSTAELQEAATLFETDRTNKYEVRGKDEGDILSNLLMAIAVRERMDGGMALNDALREHTQTVQSIVRPKKS